MVRGCRTFYCTGIPLIRSFVCCCLTSMSWLSRSYKLFSSPSSSDREHRYNLHSESYFPPTLGDDSNCSYGTHSAPDSRARDSPSPPVTIPLRNYLVTNPNFLVESSCSSLSLDSHSSERPVSYPWEVSVVEPLPWPFVSVGMLHTDVVEELDQDPVLSEGPARSNLEDGPGTHYIDPSFRDELRKIVNFEVKFSFRQNYRVIIPNPTDTVDNPPPGCVAVYLEALQLGLRFPPPKLAMEKGGTGSSGSPNFFLHVANLLPLTSGSTNSSSYRKKMGIGQSRFGISGDLTKLETNPTPLRTRGRWPPLTTFGSLIPFIPL